jgi:hypothetical protein
MQDVSGTLDMAIDAADRLKAALRKRSHRQVRSSDERMLVKATSQAWFRSHKPTVVTSLSAEPLFREVDTAFAILLEYSEQSTLRSKYVKLLTVLKANLVQLRSRSVLASPQPVAQQPDFPKLITDPLMLRILERRWTETLACLQIGADLAATVMMGGLLEALLLARVNRLSDRAPVFTATAAPKDKSGKSRPLKDWGLKDFLDVAHELGWIRQSAKDVGAVLRDYRNYVHPEKERSHGISISSDDSKMFFSVLSNLSSQIIASVNP